VIDNDRLSYGLDALGKAILGRGKVDQVKEYIKEHNLVGKNKDKQYFKVPLPIMVEYGCMDGRLTYDLGIYQQKFIEESDRTNNSSLLLSNVANNEFRLTRNLYNMERRGILLDESYTRKSWLREADANKETKQRWKTLTGHDLVNSSKGLQPVYDATGVRYGKTAKGNASFKADALSKKDEVTRLLLDYRKSAKMINSYYRNFIEYQDYNGVIHTNFRQGGAKTGRMSATQPALQTLPKDSEDKLGTDSALVRRCFVPREDYVFFMPDYDQMEYRFMLEYAREMEVIQAVLAGTDVHQATADLLGVSRHEAKTINFMLLYGGGEAKLAATLKCREYDARKKRQNYFRKLPGVKKFIGQVQDVAKNRGYIINWLGRRSVFEDENDAYKAPNSLIQGGTADIVKVALNNCCDRLQETKSHALLQVHDEIIFELHKSELHLAPELIKIMESAYPHELLNLSCTPEYSDRSLADKMKGYPNAI
jgi:DNA polymerase-1